MGFGGSAHALSQADDSDSVDLERQLRRDLRRQLKAGSCFCLFSEMCRKCLKCCGEYVECRL